MAGSKQKTVRPRLACEITSEGVIAARASEKSSPPGGLHLPPLPEGAIAPGLTIPNILDPEALCAPL